MKLLLNIFSWTEIYSSLLRTESKERADEAVGIISEFPITIVHADDELARMAANYRATTGIPYPSCFAAATAKIKAAELVTGDPEFKQLEGEIKILWLGKK
jgi:predicted nucleic acid-binding protein